MKKIKTVKLLNGYCGASGNHPKGALIDVPEDEARQLVQGGYASYQEAPESKAEPTPAARGGRNKNPAPETASAEPDAETATEAQPPA